MSETCVDDVILEEDAPPELIETKKETSAKQPVAAPVSNDPAVVSAKPLDRRFKLSKKSTGSSFGEVEQGSSNGSSKSNSVSDNGPRPRYKSIDKLSAIDQQGRKIQIWAREKSLGSVGGISNGDSLDLDFELEEPFSDSDEDENSAAVRARRTNRPTLKLPMPRRRIRSLSGTVPPTGYSPVWGGATMCLSCLEFFDLPKETDKYVTHLLEQHKIVITDIELIVDLKRYIEHWRKSFGSRKIDEIFPKIVPNDNDPLKGKVDSYYLMSEKVKEDRDLRERLALRRLEEVLSCQQRERGDFTFQAQCLFCRYRARGNRSKMIHHLYMIHHLNLGSPENLVFFNEYMDLLKAKIDNNQCLYCEKTFQDHAVLMEHMRKRQHREVNPKNSYYDRFYVINYLELGKKWLEVLAEDFEDSLPTFVDSDEEDEEESWHEWQEDNTDEDLTLAVCLMCDDSFQSAPELLDHTQKAHEVDLEGTLLSMEFYDRVKLLNCIRKLSYNRVCFVCGLDDLKSWEALRKHVADHSNKLPPKERYDNEEYLVPVFENDHLLWVLESHLNEKNLENDCQPSEQQKQEKSAENGAGEKEPVILPEDMPDVVDSILDQDPDLLEQLK